MGGPLDEAADDPDDRREFVRGWIYRSALLSIPGQITALPCSVWSGGRVISPVSCFNRGGIASSHDTAGKWFEGA